MAGPVTYDLMSLLEDARRDVDPVLVARLRQHYLAAFPELDHEAFAASWAVLAAQRHAKVIGIFTRLSRRDGKPLYLQHIPRVCACWRPPSNIPVWLRSRTGWTDPSRRESAECRRHDENADPRNDPCRRARFADAADYGKPAQAAGPGGRATMLDRVLDHLDAAEVAQRVVRTHWLGAMLHRHLADRAGVAFSDEPELLETGGGVAKALPQLGEAAFFVCNADIV